MADQPRRSRRSSISEQLHRVFVVHSVRRSTDQTPAPIPLKDDPPRDLKSDGNATTLGQSTDQTRSGSFAYSSVNSRMPSLGTPDTSPSVQPIRTKAEESAAQTQPSDHPNAARDQICSSPTWEKDTARKERRATKRLEAERKELEKRLLHLEEAQARLENGIYDKSTRRLTKKQPFGSSKRSSSANSERPRSSSGFSAFFSSSRRSSRSRSSSVNGKDLDSRRQSTDNPAPSGPPSLPLILPERFGAVISRELATKHGTTLVPSHQLQHSPHSLHSSLKSDDLRESWRMAEAWQKQYGRNSDQELSVKPEVYSGQRTENYPWKYETRSYPQPTELSADLDRERFTATLKQERRMTETTLPGGRVHSEQASGVHPKKHMGESHQQAPSSAVSRPNPTRQVRDVAPVSPENMQGSSRARGSPSSMLPAQVSANMPKKGRVDPNSQAPSRIYKSSPLALNPTNTNDLYRQEDARNPRALSATHTDYLHVPQPLRVAKPYPLEEPRSRTRAPAPGHRSSNGMNGRHREVYPDQRHSFSGSIPVPARNDRRQEIRPPGVGSNEPRQPMPGGARRQPHVAPPLKHPDRGVPSRGLAARRLGDELALSSPEALDTTTLQQPVGEISPVSTGPTERKQPGEPAATSGHTRSASGTSLKTTSSYDTADEEVLDVPGHPAERQTKTANKAAKEKVTEPSTPTEPALLPTHLRDPPPLAPDGPIAMLRQKPMQKAIPLEPNQVVAKLFVVCCHCNYWHDLPSEVYAKLACPERLPSDSLLVRTFSRKNSLGRRNSIFSSNSNGQRRLSLTRGMQAAGDTQIAGAGTAQNEVDAQRLHASQSTPLYRPQCCWCGHSMGKTCCQGWTTIVHLRERHH
ncbi:hypothetical protein N7492_004001 [Penicillium capsulatum]|uniref:Uncharacterized protein n=1 Tax=Penicillium capsulatum TaxID=69766 RepID=A0A9W9LWL8_9EURO|nr:hypothetical protein N7492_004001 [Penicillium capsulatum]